MLCYAVAILVKVCMIGAVVIQIPKVATEDDLRCGYAVTNLSHITLSAMARQ